MCDTRLMREGRDQDHLTAGENAAVVGVALNEIRITFSTIHFYVFQQRLYVTFMSCRMQHFVACLSLDNFADYVYGFVPAATAVFCEAYARLMSALALSTGIEALLVRRDVRGFVMEQVSHWTATVGSMDPRTIGRPPRLCMPMPGRTPPASATFARHSCRPSVRFPASVQAPRYETGTAHSYVSPATPRAHRRAWPRYLPGAWTP